MIKRVVISVSMNLDILEAADAVAKTERISRSALIQRCLKDNPDVYEVLEGGMKT